MDVNIKLTVDDWNSFQTFIGSEIPRKFYSGWLLGLANFLIWLAFAVVFIGTINSFSTFHWPSGISIALIFVILIINNFINKPKLLLKSLEPSIDGPFCGQHKFNFSQTDITVIGNGFETKHSWGIVKRVVNSNGLIMLFIDTAHALIIPTRELENSSEFITFAEGRVKEYNKPFKQDK
jgi:hypothetical protein